MASDSKAQAEQKIKTDTTAAKIQPKDYFDADIPADMKPLQLSRRFWHKGEVGKANPIRGFIVDVETMVSKRYGEFTALVFRTTEPTKSVDMDGVVEEVPVGADVVVVATEDIKKLALAKGSPLLTEVWLKLDSERKVEKGTMHIFKAAQGRQVKRVDYAPDTLTFAAGTNANTYALGVGGPSAQLPAAQVPAEAAAKA